VRVALDRAAADHARGAAATPAALSYINAQAGGRFLETNIAVVEANAVLAGKLAVALAGVGA